MRLGVRVWWKWRQTFLVICVRCDFRPFYRVKVAIMLIGRCIFVRCGWGMVDDFDNIDSAPISAMVGWRLVLRAEGIREGRDRKKETHACGDDPRDYKMLREIASCQSDV